MPATVIVNNMTVVHKSSTGISTAFPDVCKTPSPGGPVPIPYPNVAMSSNTAKGSSTVKMDGNPIMLKSSNYSMSTGDEAGSALGVMSNKIKGKAYPRMYSFDVKVDGENVFRQLDIMLQNGGSPTNTPPAPNQQPPGVALGGADPDDMELTKLEWDQSEACCGDEVTLSVEARNMDDQATMITVARQAPRFRIIGQVFAQLSGSSANPTWQVRRGPHEPEVRLEGWGRGLGGPRDASKQLLVKGVADTSDIYSEQRVAYGMSWVYAPNYGWCWAGQRTYSWNVHYEQKIENGELIISKRIAFNLRAHVRTGRYARPMTPRRFDGWRRQVEAVWDRAYKIHRSGCKRSYRCDCTNCGGCMFPIRVRCEWGGGHGQAVDLFPGTPDSNDWGQADLWWYSHTWWEGTTGTPHVRAHEFGHLIGMYDEYPAGGVNPSQHGSRSGLNPTVEDPTSIMGSGSTVYPRHMKEFHQWFDDQAGSIVGATRLLRY